MKKKIILFSLENISNAGDEILDATTERLIHRRKRDRCKRRTVKSIKDFISCKDSKK